MKTRLLLSIAIAAVLLPTMLHAVNADSLVKAVNQQPEITQLATTTPFEEQTIAPTFTATALPTQTFNPDPTFTPTEIPTNTPTTVPTIEEVKTSEFPSLDEFTSEVRASGGQGIWAEDLFAFKFFKSSWGKVPGSWNTASLASYKGYEAFFIHNYLGGSKLYSVSSGTKIAVIWSDHIEWYTVNGIYRFAGKSTGAGCGYTEPFTPWKGGKSVSALDIIKKYYDAPFAIQTCICSGDKHGVYIITGA